MRRRQSLHGLLALGLYAASPRVAGRLVQRDSPARVSTLDDAPEAVRAQLWAIFRKRLGELGYARREYVEAGGLLSYGSDVGTVFRRGADYVDRILRGAKPADLPFEMASTFRFVLNLSTAQALGLAIPNAVRIRADEVIE